MRRCWGALTAILGAFAFGGVGCAFVDVPDVDVPPPDRVASFVSPGCPRSAAQLPKFDGWGEMLVDGRLPSGFRPVRALYCIANSNGDPSDPSGNLLRFEVSETRAAPVGADFLQVLTLSDLEFGVGSHNACAAVAYAPAWVVLVDAGDRAVIPRLPQDPCQQPRAEADQAVKDLGFHDEVLHRFKADDQAMRFR